MEHRFLPEITSVLRDFSSIGNKSIRMILRSKLYLSVSSWIQISLYCLKIKKISKDFYSKKNNRIVVIKKSSAKKLIETFKKAELKWYTQGSVFVFLHWRIVLKVQSKTWSDCIKFVLLNFQSTMNFDNLFSSI